MLGKQSLPERKEQTIVYRDPRQLVPTQENFYNTKNIDKLKASIKITGYLMQPILIENVNGKDQVLAGHRRRLCCIDLIEEGDTRFERVPCMYAAEIKISEDESLTPEQKEAITPFLRQFKVIQANNYRDKNDWERMQEALEMEKIVKSLKEKVGIDGTVRENLKELLGVSNAQFGRYKNISNHLSEELMEEFQDGGINISVADAAASLELDLQKQAYEIFLKNKILTLPDIQLLKDQEALNADIPGQTTIEQATRQQKPEEDHTPIPVDLQIDRFFESLKKNTTARIRNGDKLIGTKMISMLYCYVKHRNGYLNYQGHPDKITFNPDSQEEKDMTWQELTEELIRRYSVKKPVKITTIDAPEKPTKKETNAGKCIHREGFNCTLEEAQKVAAGNGEDCNGKCCWNCDKHGTCGYECNASAHRPEEQVNQEDGQNERESVQFQETEEKTGYLDYAAKYLVLAWHEWFKENYQSRVADTQESITEIQNKIENQEEKTVHFATLKGTARLNFYDDCVVIRDERDKYAGDFEYAQLVATIQREWQKVETEEKSCQPATESAAKKQQKDHYGETTEMAKHLRNTNKIPDAWPEELRDIPIPSMIAINDILEDAEKELKDYLEIADERMPARTILQHQLIAGGLRLIKNLVTDCQEEPEQPELQIMRNNDQRKEWLRNYKNWGLWYTDNHTGVSYYKYDFENGARLIVEEYPPDPVRKTKWYTPEESYYMHLVGGPEPNRKYGVPKWNYRSIYDKYQNSETELVEFLKEVQK
jgi:hypothetical protein